MLKTKFRCLYVSIQGILIFFPEHFKLPLEGSGSAADKDSWSCGATHHIRNVVRVHLVQVLVIDVGIGKVKPAEQHSVMWRPGGTWHHLRWPHAHPSTRSPMLSRWPRNVRQWYCWLVSISDVFWTHTSARVCWRPTTKYIRKNMCFSSAKRFKYSFGLLSVMNL